MAQPTVPPLSKSSSSAPPPAKTNGAQPAAGGNSVSGPSDQRLPATSPTGKPSPVATTDALLARIATALERLAVNTPAPNYKRGLAAFKGFDFARLGIRVMKSDADGPSVLEWNNHYFTRRSGKGKFGVAVWFSRPIGKGESDDEELRFERLITFKDYSEAESLPAEARKGAAA